MLTNFDATTAVSPLGEGRYATELDPGWKVGAGLNGGYLLAIMGRAIAAELPSHPDPVSMSAYYLAPSTAGQAEVRVRPLRVGGTATVAADLVQGDAVAITTLATFADLGRDADDVRTTAPELDMPPVEDCVSNDWAPEDLKKVAPLMQRFDMRFHPDDVGWAVGEPSGTGLLRCWFRLQDDHEPDPISLLQVVDALPPATFTLGSMGWAPTVELTAHVRARPAPGWLKVVHATRNVAGGFFEEDCEVWDAAGRLVAQSRQLARLPR